MYVSNSNIVRGNKLTETVALRAKQHPHNENITL